ncbi:MAG: isocitrate lyase, partial [Candidatus Dadabacteria bacterium]|nr:isocitrate lyase [Candidatus Dadabacteria bacterium]
MSSRSKNKMADVIFGSIQDLRGKNILSVRDQNTFNTEFRQKRLMTLI